MANAKQVCDLRASSGMSRGQSTEHLRSYKNTDPEAKKYGYYDPTRMDLNFEVGKGGVIKPVDKYNPLDRRYKENIASRGIKEPEPIKFKDGTEKKRNTLANIIIGGSREQMMKLAFGDQQVDLSRNADNRGLQRQENIELWAKDMYNFIAKKYGEENIIAFVVHLDERNPHVHCTLVPVNEKGKISYNDIFGGKTHEEARQKFLKLHDGLAEVNAKWGLERGEDINVTGAKHRTSEEYYYDLREKCNELEEKGRQLGGQVNGLQMKLDFLVHEIQVHERKEKSFTTMINNLQNQMNTLKTSMQDLEDEETVMLVDQEDLKKELAQKQKEYEELQAKLNYRKELLQATTTERDILLKEKESIESEINKLKNQKQELSEETEKARQQLTIAERGRDEKIADKILISAADYFYNLTHELTGFMNFFREQLGTESAKEKWDDVASRLFLEEYRDSRNEIIQCATNLFLGYIEGAITVAQGCGGGGSSNNDLARKKDEDDDLFAYKCFMNACMMCRPSRKKQLKI